MASSYVEFQTKGFWCADAYLEVWLFNAVAEMDKLPNRSSWIDEIRGEWYMMATSGMTGCINLFLDTVITNDERKEHLQRIALAVNRFFAGYGESIPLDIVNKVFTEGDGFSEGDGFISPPETANFIKVGKLFIELINGRLSTTASSPLDYLRPENWKKI